ncbi:MAG: OsmC family protein [Chloroflexi bacterium]|nr:OsmC family protein [Chloroflexota bacterium]
MDIQVNWKGKMAFEGSGPSGHAVLLDADQNSGGENGGLRPMEMIAIGLAGCTAMDVVSILSKKKQAVTDFQVNFHGTRAAEHPKVFTSGILEYRIYGKNIDEAAVVRAIELSAEKYCPAQAMLGTIFPIRLLYRIFDFETKTLLKEGEYIRKTPD